MKVARSAVLLFSVTLMGCGSPAVSDYTTSRDSLFYLQQLKPATVSIGKFTDLSGFSWAHTRLEFGCSLPNIQQNEDHLEPAAYLQSAFVAELMATSAVSQIPVEPQIRGELTTLSLEKGILFDGVWTVELVLISSNGQELRTHQEYGFDTGALFGPTICHRAGEHFEPAVRSLLEKAIQSPDFLLLIQQG